MRWRFRTYHLSRLEPRLSTSSSRQGSSLRLLSPRQSRSRPQARQSRRDMASPISADDKLPSWSCSSPWSDALHICVSEGCPSRTPHDLGSDGCVLHAYADCRTTLQCHNQLGMTDFRGCQTRNLASRRRTLFHGLPSRLAPRRHLRLVDNATDAVDGNKHRGIAILSIGHREAGIGGSQSCSAAPVVFLS